MRSSDWSSDVCSSDLVAAQEEALRSAQNDLGRTTIRAPISGRIGRSTYTTGALVSASQADPLTTIQRIDPIFVDIQQSSADVLRLRQQLLSGELSREGRSEEHTSELQSLLRISYAVFCLKIKTPIPPTRH